MTFQEKINFIQQHSKNNYNKPVKPYSAVCENPQCMKIGRKAKIYVEAQTRKKTPYQYQYLFLCEDCYIYHFLSNNKKRFYYTACFR